MQGSGLAGPPVTTVHSTPSNTPTPLWLLCSPSWGAQPVWGVAPASKPMVSGLSAKSIFKK